MAVIIWLCIVLIAVAAADEDAPCLKEMELCHQTEYRAYVKCITGREKRSLCSNSYPIDCSDGSCTIVEPILVNSISQAQSCIGVGCKIDELPPMYIQSGAPPPPPLPPPCSPPVICAYPISESLPSTSETPFPPIQLQKKIETTTAPPPSSSPPSPPPSSPPPPSPPPPPPPPSTPSSTPSPPPPPKPVSTSQIDCPPNNCSNGRCTNSRDDMCCVTKCLEGCRSDICINKCLTLCGKNTVLTAEVPEPLTFDFEKIINSTNEVDVTPNVTTIIRLTNVINDTIINIEKNDTAIEPPPEPLRNETESRCCQVVQPKTCKRQLHTGYQCGHKRHRSCGAHCTADIMHAQVRHKCNRQNKCTQSIAYIPEPKPKCTYQDTWPYVACGIQNKTKCDGCYDHYGQGFKKYHGKNAPDCGGCFDDDIGPGNYYRKGPVARPGYYHQPPCYTTNSCSYPTASMGYWTMMPVFVPMPPPLPPPSQGCGNGCFGHELIDPVYGDSSSYSEPHEQRRRIIKVSDVDEPGDNDNPWDENAILPTNEYFQDAPYSYAAPQYNPYYYNQQQVIPYYYPYPGNNLDYANPADTDEHSNKKTQKK